MGAEAPILLDNVIRDLHLASGWHDGAGAKISDAALENSAKLLEQRPVIARSIRIQPTLEGDVMLKVTAGERTCSLMFLGDDSIETYGMEVGGSGRFEALVYDGLTEDFWRDLDQWVKAGHCERFNESSPSL